MLTIILSLLAFTSDTLRITGQCYDVADGAVLQTSITIGFNATSQKLNENKTDNFSFEMADSVRYLKFEAKGYETRIIPVNRIGVIGKKAAFRIQVPMLKNGLDPAIKEDETLFPKNLLFVDVDAPDRVTMHVVFMDKTKRKVLENRPIMSRPKNRHLAVNYILPGPYLMETGIFDDNEKILVRTVAQEDIALQEGFNFLSVHYKSAKSFSGTELTILKRRTLYFDQSSYTLRKDSKLVLDSVCAVLVQRHHLVAHVTGHTDNVGKRELNMILSEYRSRVVQHYMKINGVPPGQIRIDWKGSDAPVAANDREENKVKNRRVELRFVDNH